MLTQQHLRRVWMAIWIGIPICLMGQHQEVSEKPATWQGKKEAPPDTSSLLHALKTGYWQGHFRYFFMATDNAPGFTDFFGNAAGAGLRFESRPWHGFQVATSSFFVFNLLSSDFTRRDSLTGLGSRYELGLFDVEHPDNRAGIDRLEELYLGYRRNKWEARLGRQLINTPFINLQDGRMRPTLVSGIWASTHHTSKIQLQGGWLRSVSPRSTTRWFGMAESIGVYPAGVQPNGAPSDYRGELMSRGAALAGATMTPLPGLQVQVWNLFLENIFNTVLVQADYRLPSSGAGPWKVALQAIRQDASGQGGHANPERAYIPPGSRAQTWGARLGWEKYGWNATLNYNRITPQGRYLMPREWGRDPFFTFLPRERNEGFADLHAWMAQVQRSWPKAPLKSTLGSGYYLLPDPRNPAQNKYAMPSYWQTNLDLRFAFSDWMEGLEAQVLVVNKIGMGDTSGSPRLVLNKVNLFLYNVVINYHF